MQCYTIKSSELKKRIDPLYYSKIFIENEEQIHNSKFMIRTLIDLSKRIVDGPFGSDLKVEEYVEFGIPLIRVRDVKGEELIENELIFISQEKHLQLKRSKVKPGDILLTKAGSIGNACVFPEHLKEANITSHLAKIEVKDDINPKYICKYLNTKFGKLQILREGNKTTRPELNISEVSSILIIIPDKDTQSEVVKISENAYKSKKSKEFQAKVLIDSINDLILKELNINVPNFKDNMTFVTFSSSVINQRFDANYYLPKFEIINKSLLQSTYKVHRLKDIYKSGYIKGILPSEEMKSGEIRVLQIKNILLSGDININEFTTAKNIFKYEHKILNNEIIVVITGATIGKVGIWASNEEFYLGGDMIKFSVNKNINPYFIWAYLFSSIGQLQIIRETTGATNKHLSPDDFGNIKIPIPPIDIQNKIAEEVTSRLQKARILKSDASKVLEFAKSQIESLLLN